MKIGDKVLHNYRYETGHSVQIGVVTDTDKDDEYHHVVYWPELGYSSRYFEEDLLPVFEPMDILKEIL